jgi:hypothetical protein
MKQKERRKARIHDIVNSGRSNQNLQIFDRMKPRELSQAVEIALEEGIENESLKYSLREHHLSKNGEMPAKVIHALLMKQPEGFDYYMPLQSRIMEKLSHDPDMLESFLQYAQNATPGWEDYSFKEVVKTAPNGEDIYGFIGIVSYNGKRTVTPHVVFDKDRDIAQHKAHLTLVHNIMDKNLKDVTPHNDEDGYDVIRIHSDGNVSYHKHQCVKNAADALNSIIDEFELAVSNNKYRPAPGEGMVTYTFEISTQEFEGDPDALCETFTRTADSRQKARRAAAMEALNSRMIFDITGYTTLPQTSQTRAKVCLTAA